MVDQNFYSDDKRRVRSALVKAMAWYAERANKRFIEVEGTYPAFKAGTNDIWIFGKILDENNIIDELVTSKRKILPRVWAQRIMIRYYYPNYIYNLDSA
ncbi:MAG: hypothetical protein WC533_02695 [Candidatus Pacearchaeota archaeon]